MVKQGTRSLALCLSYRLVPNEVQQALGSRG